MKVRLHALTTAQAAADEMALPTQQRIDWGVMNPPGGQRDYLQFVAEDGGAVVATGLVILRKVAFGYVAANVPRGPVTRTAAELQLVLAALETALYAKGAVTITLNPPVFEDVAATQAALAARGYAPVPSELQNMPLVTGILDLSDGDDAFLARMTRSGRKDLRKAQKSGITARPAANRQEAEAANVAMDMMRQSTGILPDAFQDFARQYDYLESRPEAGILMVTLLNDQVFGAALTMREGTMGYGLNLATRPDINLPRAHLLIYESACVLRDLGMQSFDLVGYDLEGDAARMGRTGFKKHFGPAVVDMVPIMSKPLRPMLHKGVQQARKMSRMIKAKRAVKPQQGQKV